MKIVINQEYTDFLVAPAADEQQSDLSSHYGVWLVGWQVAADKKVDFKT